MSTPTGEPIRHPRHLLVKALDRRMANAEAHLARLKAELAQAQAEDQAAAKAGREQAARPGPG